MKIYLTINSEADIDLACRAAKALPQYKGSNDIILTYGGKSFYIKYVATGISVTQINDR